MVKVFELFPSNDAVEPDFDGYKLSLEEIKRGKSDLPSPVHRVLQSKDQFSFKHTKLLGLQNHLFGDSGAVYYFGSDRNVYKMQTDAYDLQFEEAVAVWKVPQVVPRTPHNMTLGFASDKLAVIGDGASNLYIVESGPRAENRPWKTVLSDSFQFSFVIESCRYNAETEELHCALHDIIYEDKRHKTSLHWVKYKRNGVDWEHVSTKTFVSKGNVSYVELDKNCAALWVASDYPFIVERHELNKYIWMQDERSVTVRCKIYNADLKVDCHDDQVLISVDKVKVLSGTLHGEVDQQQTTWNCTDGLLEVVFVKKEEGVNWAEILVKNKEGEYIADKDAFKEAHESLQYLCGDAEILSPERALLREMRQEDVDFPPVPPCAMERITDIDRLTHRVALGFRPVFFRKQITVGETPALAVHVNDDICLFQSGNPSDGVGCTMKHVGTLKAIGYVQGSKQRKKYMTCSPDLTYAAILETDRHIFIYRQNKTVSCGELRNRTSGKRVKRVAQQQVVNLTNDEIVGVHATNTQLIVMTENCIHVLAMT